MAQALDVVNRFYDATDRRRADELPALVAEDVTFAGPLMQASGAGEYVAMNEQLLGFHAGTRMLRQFEDGSDVCSLYEMRMSTPAGGSLTLLGAWRHLSGFERRSSFRSWLYRIATNVAWTAGRRRQATEVTPYPDAYLQELEAASEGPAARYDRRESVQLAFVAAMQLLPPRQRAVLLLHDVLGWSAIEVAGMLDTTPSGVNSTLHRARATLERRREEAGLRLDRTAAAKEAERALGGRFLAALDAADVSRPGGRPKGGAGLTM